MSDPTVDLLQSIRRLQTAQRLLMVLFSVMAVAIGAALWLAWTVQHTPATVPPDSVITVRGIVIADSGGVERFRISAPMPDPMVLGRRLKRQGAISGVLISDADANERGVYGTGEEYANALFTLDSTSDQHVLFMVDPSGPTQLSLFDSQQQHTARMSVSRSGARLRLTTSGATVFETPPANEPQK